MAIMSAAPLTDDEFDLLMAPLGPFEAAPRLAVAVSGGADSMALCLLAATWAARRGGESLAVTVDHRLRQESAAEAVTVAGWLAARGIGHHVLAWDGDKPGADIQAAAREARYRLLGEFCRSRGILHLLLAHHREDQAETLLLRLGRGSGLEGLAAMAPVRPTRWGRLLRPLLSQPKARLIATLRRQGQDWIEDPSNDKEDFARVRLRRLLPALAAEGLDARRLAATAARLGRARMAVEQAVAEAAARWVALHPAGFARCGAQAFRAAPEEVGLRLLARLLGVIGGDAYSPRLERLERLYGEVRGGLVAGRTLAGCRVCAVEGDILICREAARMAPPLPLVPGAVLLWDGRFRAEVAAEIPAGLRLGGLGPRGWRRVTAGGAGGGIPIPARSGLPAVWDEVGVCQVPHLGYNRDGKASALSSLVAESGRALTETSFTLVSF